MEKVAQWGASKFALIRQNKSRRMRWAEHVACMGEKSKVYRV
jgi:hypothetical protein